MAYDRFYSQRTGKKVTHFVFFVEKNDNTTIVNESNTFLY